MADKLDRPFAVFDIDGTVIRWQLYHAISDALARKGIIDKQAFDKVKQARMNWKRRSRDNSFHEYEQALIGVFTKVLSGLRVTSLEAASEEVFNEYKDQVYTYTRDLIRSLKAEGYLLFAISGSPDVIVKKLANYYGFDDFAASRYDALNGKFTGSIQLVLGKKAILLEDLINRHHARRSGSIAVGDSEDDIDMLNLAEQPIAFNPSTELLRNARQHHWMVVVERKNAIYRLEYKTGSYRLTE